MTYSFVTCFGITHFNCWFFDYAPFLLVRRPTTAGKISINYKRILRFDI